MRWMLLVGLTACGFEPRGLSGGGPGDDVDAAAIDAETGAIDAAVIDAAIDAAVDAAVIDAAVDAAIDARPIDAAVDAAIDARPIDAPPRCQGYTVVTGAPATSRYRRNNVGAAWTDAAADCTSDGGYLIVPETNAEARAVFAFVGPATGSRFYWAGISNPDRDSVWTTVLGAAFTNPPWGPNQPNNTVGHEYVLVDPTGSFFDWNGLAGQEYACECNP